MGGFWKEEMLEGGILWHKGLEPQEGYGRGRTLFSVVKEHGIHTFRGLLLL